MLASTTARRLVRPVFLPDGERRHRIRDTPFRHPGGITGGRNAPRSAHPARRLRLRAVARGGPPGGMQVHPAFWSAVPGPRQPQPVIGWFLAGLRSGERAALGSRSGSGRRADGEPDGDRRLGSSRAADWRLRREGGSCGRRRDGDATTAADRDRCGARVEPAPVTAGLPRVTRGSRVLRGAHSCACRVVPFYLLSVTTMSAETSRNVSARPR